VLGLLWNIKEDLLYFPGVDEVKIDGAVTKGDVLNVVSRVFDTLGFVIPVTFHGKVFLQTLWKLLKSWDEPLSNDLVKDWRQVLDMLTPISV